MSKLIDSFIQELKMEAVATKNLIEAIPGDKLDWQAHKKSMSIGKLAMHILTTPIDIATMFDGAEFDLATMSGTPDPLSIAEMSALFSQNVLDATSILENWSDDKLNEIFKMMMGDQEFMAAPRIGMLRSFLFNHLYHHRGQLSVNLRLLDVPLPSTYGPTADINPFA